MCPFMSASLWPHGAHQASLPMELSRQAYWSRVLLPTPGDLPNAEAEPVSGFLHWPQILYHCTMWKAQKSCVFGGGGVLSHVQLFTTLWIITHQTPLSMGFFRQECWDGLPFPPPGDLPDPGIKSMCPASPALQADSLPGEASGKPSSE